MHTKGTLAFLTYTVCTCAIPSLCGFLDSATMQFLKLFFLEKFPEIARYPLAIVTLINEKFASLCEFEFSNSKFAFIWVWVQCESLMNANFLCTPKMWLFKDQLIEGAREKLPAKLIQIHKRAFVYITNQWQNFFSSPFFLSEQIHLAHSEIRHPVKNCLTDRQTLDQRFSNLLNANYFMFYFLKWPPLECFHK